MKTAVNPAKMTQMALGLRSADPIRIILKNNGQQRNIDLVGIATFFHPENIIQMIASSKYTIHNVLIFFAYPVGYRPLWVCKFYGLIGVRITAGLRMFMEEAIMATIEDGRILVTGLTTTEKAKAKSTKPCSHSKSHAYPTPDVTPESITSSIMVGKDIPKKTIAQMKVTPRSVRNCNIQEPLLRFGSETTTLIEEGKINPKTYFPTAKMNGRETLDYIALLSETARYALNIIPFSHENDPAITPIAWGGKKLGKFISHVKMDSTVSSSELATCSFSCYDILAKIDPKKGSYFYHMAKFMIDARRVEERHLRRSGLDRQVCTFKQNLVTSELDVYRTCKRKLKPLSSSNASVVKHIISAKKHLNRNKENINTRICDIKLKLKTLKKEEKIIRKIEKSHEKYVKNVNKNAQKLLIQSIDGGYLPANDLYGKIGGKRRAGEFLYGVSVSNPSYHYTEAKEYYHEYLRNTASAQDNIGLYGEVERAYYAYMADFIEHFNTAADTPCTSAVPFSPPVDATTSTNWGEQWLNRDMLDDIIVMDNLLAGKGKNNTITVGMNSREEKELAEIGFSLGFFGLSETIIRNVENKLGKVILNDSLLKCWEMIAKGSKLAYMIRHVRDTLRIKLEASSVAMCNFSDHINYFLNNTTGVNASVSGVQDTPRGIKAKLYLYRASFNALGQQPMLSKNTININDSSNVPTQARYPIRSYIELFHNLESFLDTHPNHSAVNEVAWMIAQVGYVIYKIDVNSGKKDDMKKDIERYCNMAKSKGVVFPSATATYSTTTTWSEFTNKLEQTAMCKVAETMPDSEDGTASSEFTSKSLDSFSHTSPSAEYEIPGYETVDDLSKIMDPQEQKTLLKTMITDGRDESSITNQEVIYSSVNISTKVKNPAKKVQELILQPQPYADADEVSIDISIEAPKAPDTQLTDKEMKESVNDLLMKDNTSHFLHTRTRAATLRKSKRVKQLCVEITPSGPDASHQVLMPLKGRANPPLTPRRPSIKLAARTESVSGALNAVLKKRRRDIVNDSLSLHPKESN